ncbi:hypothetical protein E8E11_007366 [Didymella keratinophila]|nr:hypothetical protein E8E11_007366 [Didymella keratinophila]
MSSKLTELLTSHASDSDASKPSEGAKEHKMAYTRLDRSGLKISKMILGAMSYGDPSQGNLGLWQKSKHFHCSTMHISIHRLDRDTPPEEIMRALNDAIDSGKVRYIGASSMAAWELQMLNNVAEKHGWHKFISMQNYYNLIYREEEREMHPYCDFAGVGLIPWSPLATGILARPWSQLGATDRAKKNQYLAYMYQDDDKAIVDRVEEVSKKLGQSMASVATAWSLSKGVNPILGLNSTERIDEAVAAVNLQLKDEDIKALEEPYRARPVAPIW